MHWAASICLAALAGFSVGRHGGSSSVECEHLVPKGGEKAVAEHPTNVTTASATGMTAPSSATVAIVAWSQVESTNYVDYIQNLRRIGCPEKTIRDIIVADVRALYQSRQSEPSVTQSGRFWESGYHRTLGAGRRGAMDALEIEQTGVIEQLLGPESREANCHVAGDESGCPMDLDGPLAAKREDLLAWKKRFEHRLSEITGPVTGEPLDEKQQQQFDAVFRERDAELRSLLSTDELEEYALRHSWAANGLRLLLEGVHVNESEFRSLFREQKALDDSLADATRQDYREAASVAIEKSDQAMAAVLGPERWRRCQANRPSGAR
jgi:hypothetical protein